MSTTYYTEVTLGDSEADDNSDDSSDTEGANVRQAEVQDTSVRRVEVPGERAGQVVTPIQFRRGLWSLLNNMGRGNDRCPQV